MIYKKLEQHTSMLAPIQTRDSPVRIMPFGKQLFTQLFQGGKMKRTLLVLFLSCLFLMPGVLYAQAQDEPSLVNPGVSPEVWDSLMENKGSEPSLQHLLDSLGYNIDVVNDLLPTEVWVTIAGQYKEVMLAELAGWASQTSSGWYGHGNQNDRHVIFVGTNHPGDSASFTITGCDSNGLFIKVPEDDKCTDYDYYYTESRLNSDNKDHAKVYCSKKRPNEFIVAWEDTKNLGDADFNDLVLVYRMPNRAPVLEVPHDTSFFQCEPETIRFDNIRAYDSDYCGDTAVISKVQGPGTYSAGTCRFLPAAVDSAYKFVFVATDWFGATDTDTVVITVDINDPPQLTCPDDDSVHAGDTLISTDFSVTDPGGNPTSVVFLDINPGVTNTPTIVNSHVEWITTCDEDGDYVIRLVATDDCGASDTCEFKANVYNQPPQLTCPDNDSVHAGDTLISTDFSVTDPDGDTASVTFLDINPAGTNTPTIVANHVEWITTCDEDGDYVIRLVATDPRGLADTCQFTVNVCPHPPQLTCPNDTSVSAGDKLISGDFTVTDPEGDLWKVAIANMYPLPAGNWPTIVGNHVEWLTTCNDTLGSYTIVLGAADSCFNIDSCQFTVNVYPHPPQLTCPNDTSVTVGDTLISGDFTVTDPEGDLWKVAIANMYPLPAGNWPTIVGNHVEWLTTGFDTAGTYTIVLGAADSCFSIDSCQFTVNVYVQAPVITSTPDTTAFVGQPYTYDVDAIGIPTPTFALITFPTGMTINPNSGVIQWTPTAAGDSNVCVKAVNSAGADTQCFTITVAESAQVSILPQSLFIRCDHEDTLWIHLDEKVVDMDSAFFKIAYEDTLITPDTVIKGPGLAPPGNFDLSYGIYPDSILISLTVLSGSFDGPDTILGIVFTAGNYVTTAQVSIERSSLQNSEGEEIPHRTIGAEIQIDCPTSADGEDEESQNPSTYALGQNYPNPYNPVTQITYQLPQPGVVSLKIYNVQGQLVRTLVNEYKPAGAHSISWNGRSDLGMEVSSGIYFYRIQAGKFTETKRMVLIK